MSAEFFRLVEEVRTQDVTNLHVSTAQCGLHNNNGGQGPLSPDAPCFRLPEDKLDPSYERISIQPCFHFMSHMFLLVILHFGAWFQHMILKNQEETSS